MKRICESSESVGSGNIIVRLDWGGFLGSFISLFYWVQTFASKNFERLLHSVDGYTYMLAIIASIHGFSHILEFKNV